MTITETTPSIEELLIGELAKTREALADLRLELAEVFSRARETLDDGQVGWSDLTLGMDLRIGNEWQTIVGAGIEPTLEGEDRQILYLRSEDGASSRYEVTEGERFQFGDPF